MKAPESCVICRFCRGTMRPLGIDFSYTFQCATGQSISHLFRGTLEYGGKNRLLKPEPTSHSSSALPFATRVTLRHTLLIQAA